MKIVEARIYEISLPLRQAFATGFGAIDRKPELIIELITDRGLRGFGESPTLSDPIYTSEFLDGCKAVLSQFILPCVMHKEFDNIEDFVAAYGNVVGNPIAKSGVQDAFWHLLAQHDSVSLKSLMHGSKTAICVGETLDLRTTTDEILKDAERFLAKGFRRIKLKIKPGWDIQPLNALREKWPDIDISVDCNASYSSSDDMTTLCRLDEFRLSMIEQPFAARDFVGHARLQSQIKTLVCLDESIQSLDDLKTAVALGSCKVVNIKPGRVGGLLESIAIQEYATSHDVKVWCGGMLETGIGRAFNMALASRAAFELPADMSPSNTFYTDDLVSPGLTLLPNGTIAVSDEPGLGYAIDMGKLQKYSVDTVTIK